MLDFGFYFADKCGIEVCRCVSFDAYRESDADSRNVYHRVDTVKYNDMPFQVKRLFTHSAGLVVSFKTNSPTVAARWTTKGKV